MITKETTQAANKFTLSFESLSLECLNIMRGGYHPDFHGGIPGPPRLIRVDDDTTTLVYPSGDRVMYCGQEMMIMPLRPMPNANGRYSGPTWIPVNPLPVNQRMPGID